MPRLTFDITDEIHEKLSLIPYGSRKRVMVMVVENIARMIEEDRVGTLAKLIHSTLTLDEITFTGGKRSE